MKNFYNQKLGFEAMTLVVLSIFILSPVVLFAQDDQGRPVETYVPISPVDVLREDNDRLPDLEDYLNNILIFVIGISSILAIVQIAIGGIQWMTSDVADTKSAARSRIWNAIIGLLLLLSVSVVLGQINPDLLEFRLGPANSGGAEEDSENGFGGSGASRSF